MKKIMIVVLGIIFIGACNPASSPLSLPNDQAAVYPVFNSNSPVVPTSAFAGEQSGTRTLLLELQSLVKRYRDRMAEKPGWWQRISVRSSAGDRSPFSIQTSSYSIQLEEWFELDSQGKISAGFSRQQDATGKTLQVSLLSEGLWHNLTYQAESLFDPMNDFDFGASFVNLASQLVQAGNHINKQILYNNCWYVGEQYRILDKNLLHEAVFIPGSGEIRWLKTWDISTNNLTLVESVEIKNEEWALQPPAEILAQLKQTAAH